MKTIFKMHAKSNGVSHNVVIEKEGTPEQAIQGVGGGLKELFARRAGFIPDQLDCKIEFSRNIDGFSGGAGFETNNLQTAIEEGRKMAAKSSDELFNMFLKELPTPDKLFTMAVAAFTAGDKSEVERIARIFIAISMKLVPELAKQGEEKTRAAFMKKVEKESKEFKTFLAENSIADVLDMVLDKKKEYSPDFDFRKLR